MLQLKFQLMLCLFATRWKTLFIAWEYQLKRASLIACFNLWGRCRKVVQAWNMQNTVVHRCGSSAGPPCAATVFQRKTSIWQLIVVILLNVQPERSEFSLIFKGPFPEKPVLATAQITTQVSLVLRVNSNPGSVSCRIKTGLSPPWDVQRTSCHHPEGWHSFHSLREQKKLCLWLLCEKDWNSYYWHYLIFPKLSK